MKKIFVILSVVLASVAVADELTDLLKFKQYAEELRSIAELKSEVVNFAQWEIEKSYVRNPNIFKSAYECFPHTYVWYKWKDYDNSNAIGKVKILQEIEKLTKE